MFGFIKKTFKVTFISAVLLGLAGAGAYAFAMASTYNSRGRPAEVMVNGNRHDLIRARENHEDLVRGERIPEWD